MTVKDSNEISLTDFPIFFFFLEDMVDIPGHVFTRGMIIAVVISVVVICLVTMGVIYRVDLVLFYRHFMGRDETLTGNECHNAGISYLTVSLRSYELIFTLCWLYCWVNGSSGEGHGNPLQYSGLGNPMDGGAWWATVHGVKKSRTRLSDFTFTFHFLALEKEMATHSSILAWRIPGMGAWWAAVYGVTRSWTRLMWLSSSSNGSRGFP